MNPLAHYGFKIPYILEERDTSAYEPEEPMPCACKQTPTGKTAMLIRPCSRYDALRYTQALNEDPEVHCCLLAFPKLPPTGMKERHLTHWQTESQRWVKVPVFVYEPNKCYACGDKPLCQKSATLKAQEQAEIFVKAAQKDLKIDGALKIAYPYYTLKERQILHAWAYNEDPEEIGQSIRIKVLAKRFNVTVRTIYRLLNKAKDDNAAIFKILEAARHDRAQITHAYTVSEA